MAKVEWHNGGLFPHVGFIVSNLTRPAKRVVRFYKQRGTAEQWIKESKNVVKWNRLSCHDFVDNQVRLQLFVLAYVWATSCGRRCRRKQCVTGHRRRCGRNWSRLGAKVVRHSRNIIFRLVEVAVTRELFQAILERIGRLRLAAASG
jgi:hypothetical protein